MENNHPILITKGLVGTTRKIKKAGNQWSVFLLILVMLWNITACNPRKIILTGTEHLVCSPDIQFVEHTVTCEKDVRGGWPYVCQLSGSIVNNGAAPAYGVVVWMESGGEIQGIRNTTFNSVGDLNPGQKVDFGNGIFLYELPDQYDIRIECREYLGEPPTPTPTPKVSFTSHGPMDDIFTLAFDPAVPTTLYAGTQTQGVFKSLDGGLNWIPVNTGLDNVKIGALVIDPFSPNTIYAGTYGDDGSNGAAYKSLDGGSSWFEISGGMDGAYILSMAIDPLTPTTLYAGTSDGLFKSINGGETWQMLDTHMPDPYIRQVVTDPRTPDTLYAVWSGSPWDVLLKSINGGSDWSVIKTIFQDTNIEALVVDPLTPTTLYAGTWTKGIFKSTDAGEHWTAANAGLTEYDGVSALVIDPADPSTLYAAIWNRDIFKSTDGGESWISIDSNLRLVFVWDLALDPADPSVLYAATEEGVYILGK